MFTLIEALRFRCLRYVSQPLGEFHVLVGPNASGKTTFLDVVAFVGDLVSNGIDKAVAARTSNFQDLTWRRQGGDFELAIEARIPDELRKKLHSPEFDTIRYEVSLVLDSDSQELHFRAETAVLKKNVPPSPVQLDVFPSERRPPATILMGTRGQTGTVLNKVGNGNDNFYSETYSGRGKGWVPAFKLGPRRSALANLPEDESRFPVATWLKSLLADGVQQLILNSLLIRQASPPGQGRGFRADGANLPWVVAELERQAPDRIRDWIGHLQTALPDLRSIRTVERPDDKHRYLMLGYRSNVEVPSWMASDGTLRLLALTPRTYPGFPESILSRSRRTVSIHGRSKQCSSPYRRSTARKSCLPPTPPSFLAWSNHYNFCVSQRTRTGRRTSCWAATIPHSKNGGGKPISACSSPRESWAMASSPGENDLMVLVPDSNTEYALKGLLSRPEALGTRRIRFTTARHPERDPGCFLRAPDFLRVFRRSSRHALVLLDREGSGRESQSRTHLEEDLEKRLSPDWNDRAAAVVIDPELEIWLWSDSLEVDHVLGWQKREPELRSWLVKSGYALDPLEKPSRPKEATEAALRLAGKARSSAIYRRLAERVSLRRCTDPGFQKLVTALRGWFPPTSGL